METPVVIGGVAVPEFFNADDCSAGCPVLAYQNRQILSPHAETGAVHETPLAIFH